MNNQRSNNQGRQAGTPAQPQKKGIQNQTEKQPAKPVRGNQNAPQQQQGGGKNSAVKKP